MIKALSVIICLVFSNIFASPQMSPTAIRIMREIRIQYQNERANVFLSAHLRDRNLDEEQIFQIRERMNYFFESNTFIETGAAYLTALFNERELDEILRSAENGELFETDKRRNPPQRNSRLTRQIQNLFSRLDPFLFQFLEQNIIPQPINQE